MQLVAYGAQDIYLTGNPQMTFFKVVYRRHTNFSMESIKQFFDGNDTYGGNAVATISRNGDLLYKMYLEHDGDLENVAVVPAKNLFIITDAQYGSHLMKQVDLEIGGQIIDRQYGHWHSVYSQLTEFNPTGRGGHHSTQESATLPHPSPTLYDRMTGNGVGIMTFYSSMQNIQDEPQEKNCWTVVGGGWHPAYDKEPSKMKCKIFIPFYFWFCRNPGLALPLIALQYHEVKVKIKFEDLDNLASGYQNVMPEPSGDPFLFPENAENGALNHNSKFNLWCDYIYLDTDERRRFAQVSHEYLIEQVQYQSFTSRHMELYFNHPVKEIIWANPGEPHNNTHLAAVRGGDPDAVRLKALNNIIANKGETTLTGSFQLKLNGHDRFAERDYRYFTRTQVWEHHTGYGGTINPDSIAVYSFALKPEEHQPSGTCNFSRIDNAQLICSEDQPDDEMNVYAVNYNVLRIMSGMGGLAYSN